MMKRGMEGRRVAAICVVLLAFTQPVAAQPPSALQTAEPRPPTPSTTPPESGPEIVIVGRDKPDVVAIQRLARAITPNEGFDRPIARFVDPVCVAASGLPKDLLKEIAGRILNNAAEAGIRLGGDQCQPNVAVLFVEDGQTEMQWLKTRRSDLFRGMSQADIRDLLADRGPVHVLTKTADRGRGGDVSSADGNTGQPELRVSDQSRVVVQIRRDIVSSFVLIDRSAIANMTAQQVADYATMQALAMVRSANATGGDTILNLFAPGGAPQPQQMSAFDRGYLKALYAGAGYQHRSAKIAEMVRRISRTDKDDGSVN